MEKVIEMKYAKSTKGTHVYQNADSDAIKSVYISKGGIPEPAAEYISITINTPEDDE